MLLIKMKIPVTEPSQHSGQLPAGACSPLSGRLSVLRDKALETSANSLEYYQHPTNGFYGGC